MYFKQPRDYYMITWLLTNEETEARDCNVVTLSTAKALVMEPSINHVIVFQPLGN